MKLNYGAFAQIMYMHIIPQPNVPDLTDDLLAAALDDGLERLEVTQLNPSTKSNYFNCKVEVKKDIKKYYRRAGTYRRVCAHFKANIVPLLKRPRSELFEDFRELIKDIEEEQKKEWLELAVPKSLTRFLAKIFIYAVLQPNKLGEAEHAIFAEFVKSLESQESPPPVDTAPANSMDRLASSLAQDGVDRIQEMLTVHMETIMAVNGITSEAPEEYDVDKYVGPKTQGKPHGEGKVSYPDGSIYEGNWLLGKRHGHGTLTRATGIKIIGEWQDDKLHGWTSTRSQTKDWEQRIEFINGKPHGPGAAIDSSGKTETFWQTDESGMTMTIFGNSCRAGCTIKADGKILVEIDDDTEKPYIKAKIHGYYFNTGTRIYLRDGSFSIEYDDGEVEIRKGNLSYPELELFGTGELTVTGTWGRRHWSGTFTDDNLYGYATATYEDDSCYEGMFADSYKYFWGKLTVPHKSGEDKYVGQWRDGSRHGRGKETYADGSSYVGQWEYGRYHGRGKRIFPDQSSYEGEWKNGRFYGRGVRVYEDASSYAGQWKNGLYDGLGTKKNRDGKVVYVGVWRCGKICGRGTYYRPDGTKSYVGESIDGIMHGRGRALDESGAVIYEGEFYCDRYDGYGIKRYLDKSIYVGQWERGCCHGRGKKVWAHGTYTGEWQNDKPHGRGTFESVEGWSYTGEWANEQAHGLGIRTEADGTRKKGLFVHGEYKTSIIDYEYKGEKLDGVPHGYGVCLDSDFCVYKGLWAIGKKHGTGTMKYLDGTTIQGEWVNNNLAMPSQVKMFACGGKLYEGEISQSGKYHGFGKLTEANGTVRVGEWSNGSFTGRGEVTYPSGAYFSGNWEDGKGVGFCLCKEPDGRVLRGVWRGNKLGSDGYAIEIQPNSDAFWGEVKNEQRHGIGRTVGANSRILNARYHEGKQILSGNVLAISSDSESYQGEFLEGEFHGKGRCVHADGAVYSGIWKNNRFTGNGHCYIVQPCDRIYQGQLSDSIYNGRGTLIHLNGTDPFVLKGIWKKGVLSGKGECTLLNGTTHRGLFQDGAPAGRGDIVWFDGREGEWKDGNLNLYSRSTEQEESV